VTDFDVDAWLEEYQPLTVEARVCTRFDLLEQHAKLEADLGAASTEAKRKTLARKIVKLEADIEAVEKVFVFADIGGRWLDLIGKHPPTVDQLKADKTLDHNPDTFPVAVVAESSSAPKLTVDQVQKLRDRLRLPEWQKLWAATLEANLGMATVPKSLLAGLVLRQNGRSATTPVATESPAASS
jgi:hypothetical protein